MMSGVAGSMKGNDEENLCSPVSVATLDKIELEIDF